MISKNTSDFYFRQSNFLPTVSLPVSLADCLRAVRAGGSQAGQTLTSCPAQVVSYSLDTIYLSYKMKYEEGRIFEKLRDAKAAVQGGVESSTVFDFGTVKKFDWSLQRSGVKFYPFVLRMGDITMCISSRSHDSNMPNCTIQIGSLTCQNDLKKTMKDLRWWFGVIGLVPIEEKVTRFDIAADFLCNIKDIDIADQDKLITRATTFSSYFEHRSLTGIQIGKGDIVLRIYDKQQEMKTKQATEKIEFFNDKWETFPIQSVTRVEFQVRGQAIPELVGQSGRGFNDVLLSLDCVWEYLTQDWARFTEKRVDRVNKNQQYSKISAFWRSVQDVIDDDTFKASRSKKIKHISIKALTRQARGIMLSLCAAYGHHVDDFFGMIASVSSILTNELSDYMQLPDFARVFRNKQALAVIDL